MQIPLTFNIRPVSIAYFIDDGDLDRFVEVALLCCTQWGGIHNSIVPVRETGIDSWFSHALNRHEPDIVVPACEKHGDVLRSFLRERFKDVVARDWESFVSGGKTVHATAFLPRFFSDPPAVPNPSDPRPALLIYESEPHRDAFGRACETAAFGAIYPGQRASYEGSVQLVSANRVVPGTPFLDHQLRQDPLSSAINLTNARIVPYQVRNAVEQAHFDIVVASTVWDLCWYWTKRGVDDATSHLDSRRVLLVPAVDFADPVVRYRLFATIRRELAAASPHVTSDLDLNFITSRHGNARPRSTIRQCERHGDIRQLHEGEGVGATRRWGKIEGEWPALRHTGNEALTYTVNCFLTLSGPYLDGLDYMPPKPIDVHEGRNTLYVPPHPPLSRSDGHVALDLASDLWDRYPKCQSLAEFVHNDSRFTVHGLTIRTLSCEYDMPWEIRLPSDLEAVRMYFSERGYEASLGPAGRKAQALVALTGGIRECDMLRDAAVFHLLQALAIRTTTKVAQSVTKLLHGRIGPMSESDMASITDVVKSALLEADVDPANTRTPSTFRQLRDTPSLGPFRQRLLDILDTLTSKRIVFRGVHVRCNSCDTRSWFPLGSLADFITCPACFTEQHMSVREYGNERPFEYRLNAAVNSALDQDVLAPILLLAKLVNEQPDVHAPLVGIELKRLESNDAMCDFDVVYVKRGVLYAGECKAGSHLNDKDIQIARIAFELGCGGFHFAALQGFDEASLVLIEEVKAELTDRNFSVTVYEGRDLLL